MTLTHDETLTAVENNDPPIEIGQIWIITDKDGTELVRGLRILAPYPKEGNRTTPDVPDNLKRKWLTEDIPEGRIRDREIGVSAEYNLRRVFRLQTPVDQIKRVKNIRPTEKGRRIVEHVRDVHDVPHDGCEICEEILADFPANLSSALGA